MATQRSMNRPTVRPSRMADTNTGFAALQVDEEGGERMQERGNKHTALHKGMLHAFSGATTALVAAAFLDGSRFGWHPTMMATAYAFSMAQGMHLATDATGLPPGNQRLRQLIVHAWTMAAAVACAGLGAYAIYSNKTLHDKPHFVSLHARIGLATLCLSVVAPLLGVVAFKKLGIYEGLPLALQTQVKWLHRNTGKITFFLAGGTSLLGLNTPSIYKGWVTLLLMGLVLANSAAVASYIFTGRKVEPRE